MVGMSCTTLLIGKSASCSGATIIARNDDSGSGRYDPKRLVAVAPTDQPRHYRSTLSHVEIDLPDDPCRYTIAPNVLPNRGVLAEAGASERNVAMSATETIAVNERVLAADPLVELRPAEGVPGEAGYRPETHGGIGEEDIITLVLPYVSSAREGVERLGELLERYGTYESNGERIDAVEDVLKEGDTVEVVVQGVDDRGKISLAIPGFEDQENNAGRGRRDDRGDRGDRRGGPRRRSDRDDDFDDRPRRRRSDRDYDDRDDRGYDRDDRPRRRSDRDDRDYDRDDRRGGRSDDRRGGRRGGYDRNPRYATDENYDEYRADRVERSERPRRRVRRDFDPFEN